MTPDIVQQSIFHSNIWSFVTFVVTIIGIIATCYFFWLPRQETNIKEQLADAKNLELWIDRFSKGISPRNRFNQSIEKFLSFTDSWIGNSTKSAFSRCLQLAFLYPLLLLIIQWVISGTGTLGSEIILENDPSFWSRLFRAMIMVSAFIVLVVYLTKMDDISEALNNLILRIPLIMRYSKYPAVRKTAGYFAVAVAVAVAFAFASAFVFAFASAFAGAVAVAGAFAFAGAFAVAVAGVLLLSRDLNFSPLLVYTFFLVLMPIVNAVLDTVSWEFTRLLMRWAQKTKAGWLGLIKLAVELLADLAAAFLFLLILAVLIPLSTQLLNNILASMGSSKIVDWQQMIETAQQAPFSSGLMVTGMLLTTLLPTAIHLATVLAGFFVVWTPRHKTISNLLKRIGSENPPLVEEMQRLVKMLALRELWVVPALFISLPLVIAIGYYLLQLAGENLVDILVATAYWGGNLI